jgi:hypothetical protein
MRNSGIFAKEGNVFLLPIYFIILYINSTEYKTSTTAPGIGSLKKPRNRISMKRNR